MPKRKTVKIGMTFCQNCKNDSDSYKSLSWPQVPVSAKTSEVTTASSVTPHQSVILPAVCYTSGQI